MNRRYTILSALTLIGAAGLPLLGCGGGSAPTSAKVLRSYYPEFALNNRWTFRVTEGGTTRTETQQVRATENHGGVTAYLRDTKNAAGKRLATEVLSLTDRYLRQHGWVSYDEEGNQEDSIRYPTPWALDLRLASGEESDQSFVLNDTLDELPVVSTFRVRVRNAGLERITVPAGTFQAAKQVVRTTITVKIGEETGPPEESTHTEWRVEGIGPIKSVDSDGVTQELTGAQVNGTTIP